MCRVTIDKKALRERRIKRAEKDIELRKRATRVVCFHRSYYIVDDVARVHAYELGKHGRLRLVCSAMTFGGCLLQLERVVP